MGILRNGFKVSRSSSPVMMQEAFAAMASSKNLLFLGSRQVDIVMEGVNIIAFVSTLLMISHRSISSGKYLSNFCLNKTSINSSIVLLETTNSPKKWLYQMLSGLWIVV